MDVLQNNFQYEKEGYLEYNIEQSSLHVTNKSFLNEIVLRVYVEITTPYILQSPGTNLEQSQEPADPHKSKYRHLVVFENQLRKPPRGAIFDLMDWSYLQEYRVDDSAWYMVDIDGWFDGNKLLYRNSDIHNSYVY